MQILLLALRFHIGTHRKHNKCKNVILNDFSWIFKYYNINKHFLQCTLNYLILLGDPTKTGSCHESCENLLYVHGCVCLICPPPPTPPTHTYTHPHCNHMSVACDIQLQPLLAQPLTLIQAHQIIITCRYIYTCSIYRQGR